MTCSLFFLFFTVHYSNFLTGCLIENNVAYNSFDIWNGEVENQQACADLSASTSGGLFWTYQTDSKLCFIKSSDSGRVAMENRVSGHSDCGQSSGMYPLPFGLVVMMMVMMIYNAS